MNMTINSCFVELKLPFMKITQRKTSNNISTNTEKWSFNEIIIKFARFYRTNRFRRDCDRITT